MLVTDRLDRQYFFHKYYFDLARFLYAWAQLTARGNDVKELHKVLQIISGTRQSSRLTVISKNYQSNNIIGVGLLITDGMPVRSNNGTASVSSLLSKLRVTL